MRRKLCRLQTWERMLVLETRSKTFRRLFILPFLIFLFFVFLQNDFHDQNARLGCAEDLMNLKLNGPPAPDDPQLITEIRKRFIYEPSNKPYRLKNYVDATEKTNRELGPKKRIRELSLGGETQIYISEGVIRALIAFVFEDEPSGFFIEAGAMDGEFMSNTLPLEGIEGWTGLLVEPDRKLHKQLLQKNRKAWSSPVCLSTKSYPFKTILTTISKPNRNPVEELFGKALNAIEGSQRENDDMRLGEGFLVYEEVQCIPLQSILLAINQTKVDLFSLDVEGAEEDILKTIPWNDFEINSLVIEHSRTENSGMSIDLNFIKWMDSVGYSLYVVTYDSPHSYFFMRRGSSLYQRKFNKRSQTFMEPYEKDPSITVWYGMKTNLRNPISHAKFTDGNYQERRKVLNRG